MNKHHQPSSAQQPVKTWLCSYQTERHSKDGDVVGVEEGFNKLVGGSFSLINRNSGSSNQCEHASLGAYRSWLDWEHHPNVLSASSWVHLKKQTLSDR